MPHTFPRKRFHHIVPIQVTHNMEPAQQAGRIVRIRDGRAAGEG